MENEKYIKNTINNNYIHSVWIDESLGSMDIFYGAHETGSDNLVNVQRMNQNIEESPYVQKDPKLHWHNDILFCSLFKNILVPCVARSSIINFFV